MALYAAAFSRQLMVADRIPGNNRIMTLETDLFRGFCKHLAVRRGMGSMTARTVILFYRCMDEAALELLLKISVAGQAHLSFCSGLQFKLVLRLGLGSKESRYDKSCKC